MSGHRVLHDILKAPFLMPDPGDAGTITVDRSFGVVPVVTATAETRTLATPTKAGVVITISLDTDGGDCTLTVTNGYNQAGSTTITLDDAGDFVTLQSFKIGSNYRWRVTDQEGTGLTETDMTVTTLTYTDARCAVAAINAAGNNQANGTALVAGLNVVGAADNTTCVVLPTAVAGKQVLVRSTTAAKTLPVFPASGGQVDALGANNAYTIAAATTGGSAMFVASNATQWYSFPGEVD